MKILFNRLFRLVKAGILAALKIGDSARAMLRRFQGTRYQQMLLQLGEYDKCNRLVVFFIPGRQIVTGGTLQIFSLYRLSIEFYENKSTAVAICWIPGTGQGRSRFEEFKNDVNIFEFNSLLKACISANEVIMHLPEFAALRILRKVGRNRLSKIHSRGSLWINILNQNIERMLQPDEIHTIKQITSQLTCTAGNPIWASQMERERLGIPLHILPTWYYPDDAPWQTFETKRDLMIVSPDRNEHKARIMQTIERDLPDLEIRVIWDLKYEEYLELERVAKWSLTFGEGLDGYFYGPVLRGGIGFAVRNGTFDLLDLDDIETVFADYDVLERRIVECIKELNNKNKYEDYNSVLRERLLRHLGRDKTSSALNLFYQGRFSYP